MATPLIPELGRQRQVDFKFKANLVYRVSSRIARAAQRNPVLENKQAGSLWAYDVRQPLH